MPLLQNILTCDQWHCVLKSFFLLLHFSFLFSAAYEYSETCMTPSLQAQTAEVAGEKTSAKLTGMVRFQFGFRFCQSVCKKMKEIIKAPVIRLSEQLKARKL